MGRRNEGAQFRTAAEREKWARDWNYWRAIVKERTKGRKIILTIKEGSKE